MADRRDERTGLADYAGGYGGGRERAADGPEHGFGERGWGDGRGEDVTREHRGDRGHRRYPEGAEPVSGGRGWEERYARENSSKYGQWGGQPIVQRGSSQSMGGYEHREQSLGDTRDVSPRGAYGIRETERWGEQAKGRGNFGGRGPKNYTRSDDRISEEVCRRLTDHPEVDASEIHVQVKNGEVTLAGFVDDRHARWAAEDTVSEIAGVREVHNDIRVQKAERTVS